MWSYSACEELHKNFTKVSKKNVPFTHFYKFVISLNLIILAGVLLRGGYMFHLFWISRGICPLCAKAPHAFVYSSKVVNQTFQILPFGVVNNKYLVIAKYLLLPTFWGVNNKNWAITRYLLLTTYNYPKISCLFLPVAIFFRAGNDKL